MKLTKEQAIDYSIELWEWLAETGKLKKDWKGWGEHGENRYDCFLCEYDDLEDEDCSGCPYFNLFDYCTSDEAPFTKWEDALTPKTRKKYAKLFLEQLYQLKEVK